MRDMRVAQSHSRPEGDQMQITLPRVRVLSIFASDQLVFISGCVPPGCAATLSQGRVFFSFNSIQKVCYMLEVVRATGCVGLVQAWCEFRLWFVAGGTLMLPRTGFCSCWAAVSAILQQPRQIPNVMWALLWIHVLSDLSACGIRVKTWPPTAKKEKYKPARSHGTVETPDLTDQNLYKCSSF